MHVKGAYGSRQTAMNDPGAQQPSQMFLTWVKARPQHREVRALLLVCGFFNIPQLFTTRVVRQDLRLIVLIREDLKVHLLMQLQRQHFLLSYFKTLSVAPAGVKLTHDLPRDNPMLNQLCHR